MLDGRYKAPVAQVDRPIYVSFFDIDIVFFGFKQLEHILRLCLGIHVNVFLELGFIEAQSILNWILGNAQCLFYFKALSRHLPRIKYIFSHDLT